MTTKEKVELLFDNSFITFKNDLVQNQIYSDMLFLIEHKINSGFAPVFSLLLIEDDKIVSASGKYTIKLPKSFPFDFPNRPQKFGSCYMTNDAKCEIVNEN